MKEDNKLIMLLLQHYLDANPTVRFGQALHNLNINEFANTQNPALMNHYLRDIHEDSDSKILKRMSEKGIE